MPSANGHGSKRAILYARVSTEEQVRSGYSLAQQLEALRGYAAQEGYEVLEEIIDPGQSGASLERPGMDQVRNLVAAGGVSVVLAQDRDRFAREPAYHYLLRREFEEHGTTIRALNDRGDNSPEGELTDGILDQLAKFERAKTAERTCRGQLRKAREGKVIAGRQADYGFRYNAARDGYEVHEHEITVVRRIFRMIGEGSSVNGTRATLEADRIPPPRGMRWQRNFVRECIFDDVYKPPPSRRSQPWSPQKWPPGSTPLGATGSGGTTAAEPNAPACPNTLLPDGSTKSAHAIQRNHVRNGLPCRCRTPAFPRSLSSGHAPPSRTTSVALQLGAGSGNSLGVSSAALSAVAHW
jgi:DNA invertase Pin-like site-specific DNA recombinase